MQDIENTVVQRLASVRTRIAASCARAGRDPGAVHLLAVSKTFPASAIAALASAGQDAFGENYVQEALDKIPDAECRAARCLQWHLVGPVQSNKTAAIAARFDWAHSVDRLKIAQRLSAQRPPGRPPLSVCVQVNVSGETSKSGCEPARAGALCAAISALPGIHLRGLMCIPSAAADLSGTRSSFRALHQLFQDILHSGHANPHVFDTLSMGMSADFEVAIEEGATIIRVGSALFGLRTLR